MEQFEQVVRTFIAPPSIASVESLRCGLLKGSDNSSAQSMSDLLRHIVEAADSNTDATVDFEEFLKAVHTILLQCCSKAPTISKASSSSASGSQSPRDSFG
jgi:hypothetical protein